MHFREEIPYSQMTHAELWARYRLRCDELGIKPVRPKPKERYVVARELALLMTQKTPKRIKKRSELRQVVIEELCRVARYEPVDWEGGSVSVGYSYADVVAAVRRRLPKSKITNTAVRAHATNIRNGTNGYEGAKLPVRRPHSNAKKEA